MKRPTGYTLVGVPLGGFDDDAIIQKLGRYLAHDPVATAIVLDDSSGRLSQFFGDRLIDSIGSSTNLGEKRQLVENSNRTIFFWDGTRLSDYIYFALAASKPTKIVALEITRVVNKDHGADFEIYIGRGTPWGNPYAVGVDGDRAAVVEMYKAHFKQKFVDSPSGNRAIRSLRGRVLGCHCKPEACHGDVIASYLNSLGD